MQIFLKQKGEWYEKKSQLRVHINGSLAAHSIGASQWNNGGIVLCRSF